MTVWQRAVGRRPIVTRLVLAVAAAMTVVLVVAAAFVYWRVSYALDRQLDQDLAAWRRVVERSVAQGQEPPGDTPGLYYQLYDDRGRLLDSDEGVPRLVSRERVLEPGSHTYDVGSFLPAADRAYRVETSRVSTPSGTRVVASVISRRKHDEALRELLLQLAIADLLALAAASFVGYRTARAALDPVESYRRAAAAAGAGGGSRLPVAQDRDDELVRLGHTFNELLERIDEGAERERQFLADASHELRTPLSVMSTELEWLRHRPRTAAQTEEAMESLQGQVSRLVELANALLELEELRAGGDLGRSPVSLRDVVQDAERGLPRGTEVEIEVPDVRVAVNGRWLTIALGNLLVNAVRHGAPPLTLDATYDEPVLRVSVRDAGPGFPQDFAAQAFDRFTRAEASRTTPGSGLGLALVQEIAAAHGGGARLLPGPGGGVEVELVAPREDDGQDGGGDDEGRAA